MTALGRNVTVEGAALINGSDGAISGTTGFSDGGCISAVSRTATGAYTVTLSPAEDALQNIALIQIRDGAANANAQIAWTSDTALALTSFVGTVATDENLQIMVFKAKPSTQF